MLLKLILPQIASAMLFAISGAMSVFSTKHILTDWNFKYSNFIGLCQTVTMIAILLVGRYFNKLSISSISGQMLKYSLPIAMLSCAKLAASLKSTQLLNVPTFSALIQLSLPMTIAGEFFVLKKTPTMGGIVSVIFIVTGSILAAYDKMATSGLGFIFIAVYTMATTGISIMSKKALNNKKLVSADILFYCPLFSAPTFVAMLAVDDGFSYVYRFFQTVSDFQFYAIYVLAVSSGLLMMVGWVWCTKLNSPLTVQIVSTMRGTAIVYLGMIRADYSFEEKNFAGINLIVVGGLIYATTLAVTTYRSQMSDKKSSTLSEPSTNESSTDDIEKTVISFSDDDEQPSIKKVVNFDQQSYRKSSIIIITQDKVFAPMLGNDLKSRLP